MANFYDELTPFYHLIHQDWDASVRQQGTQLSTLLEAEWSKPRRILDVTCGIGTQAIALAMLGYEVTASDLSEKEIERARKEAERYGTSINFSVCDVRKAHVHHGTGFDVVISGDNSLPHLLMDEEILLALEEMYASVVPGGGTIITVRDYETETRGKNIVKPYGARIEGGKRYILFQVWDFEGEHYNLAFYFIEENLASGEVTTRVMRSKYYAISTDRLCDLMREVGFEAVRRIDDAFYQPILVGTKPYNSSLNPDSQQDHAAPRHVLRSG